MYSWAEREAVCRQTFATLSRNRRHLTRRQIERLCDLTHKMTVLANETESDRAKRDAHVSRKGGE